MLSAHARNDARADRVGADLSREIDFDRRVDRHHLGILTDAEGVVRPGHVAHFEVLAVVHVVVEPLRAEGQRRHVLVGQDFLLRVVDDAALDQGHHAVGHGLGVQSEVLVVRERREHGVRNAAHADLERCAVGNELGDVAADAALDLVGHAGRQFDQRFVHFDRGVDLRDVDQRVAVREGHGGIDLRDDGLGALHGRHGQVGRDAVGAVAVGIGPRDVEDRHVHGQQPAAEEPRDFAQERRDGLAVALCEPAADVVGHEEAVHEERILEFGLAVGGVAPAYGECRVERDVGELRRAVGHRLHEHLGNRGAALDVNVVVRADQFHGLGRCGVVCHGQSLWFCAKSARRSSSMSNCSGRFICEMQTRIPSWWLPVEVSEMAQMP